MGNLRLINIYFNKWIKVENTETPGIIRRKEGIKNKDQINGNCKVAKEDCTVEICLDCGKRYAKVERPILLGKVHEAYKGIKIILELITRELQRFS